MRLHSRRGYTLLQDRVFISAGVIYILNFFATRYLGFDAPFFRGHLNDLLLVPCLLPPLLFAVSAVGYRSEESPPHIIEVLSCLVVWSFAFELLAPRIRESATGDPMDVAAYWLGGLIAWGAWQLLYRRDEEGQCPLRAR